MLRLCEPAIPLRDPIDKENTCGRGTMNSLRQNDQDWRPHPTNVPRIANTILSTTWADGLDCFPASLWSSLRSSACRRRCVVKPCPSSWRRSSFPDSNAGSFTEPAVSVNPNNPQRWSRFFRTTRMPPILRMQDAPGTQPKAWRPRITACLAMCPRPTTTWAMPSSVTSLSTSWGRSTTGDTTHRATACSCGARSTAADLEKQVAVSEYPSEPGIPFEDKPSIVSDATSDTHTSDTHTSGTNKSRYAGNLYVGWTRWTLTGSE